MPEWMVEPTEGEVVRFVWSAYITPEKFAGWHVPLNEDRYDDVRLAAVQENILLLRPALDKLVDAPADELPKLEYYHWAVERGKVRNKPHNQGIGVLKSRRTVNNMLAYLKHIHRCAIGYEGRGVRRVPGLKMPVEISELGDQTESYLLGYTHKDRRQPWYRDAGKGTAEAFTSASIEEYENYASDKQKAAHDNTRYNPTQADHLGKPALITKTNFVDGAEHFGLRSHKKGEPNRNLITIFAPSTMCLVAWWLQTGRAILAPSWVTTYGRGDADEDKLELLREITWNPATARDIGNVRYLLMNQEQPPSLSKRFGLLYRPRIMGNASEHERLSFQEAMEVIENNIYPLFITLSRELSFIIRPKGHIFVCDLACELHRPALETLCRELCAHSYNVTPATYNLGHSPDCLGHVATGIGGLIQQDCSTIALRDVTISMLTRFLTEGPRFAALEELKIHGIAKEDDGTLSLPLLAVANQIDMPTFLGVLCPSGIALAIASQERKTQSHEQSSVALLRKTYVVVVKFQHPAFVAQEIPIHLAPFDEDEEGNPIPEPTHPAMRADPNPPDYYRPHHVLIAIRYGPHPIVSQVLKRENLTPFGAGQIDRPEMDLPSGWNGRSAGGYRRRAGSSVSPSSPEIPYPHELEEDDY